MRKHITAALAATLVVGLAACGQTDHGGYASQDEGCAAFQAKVAKGPIIEGDEIEYHCSDGHIVEATRSHVKGPDAKDHLNPWTVDEDSLVCPDGSEITTGDESRFRERCNEDGTAERDPNGNYNPGYYDDEMEDDD